MFANWPIELINITITNMEEKIKEIMAVYEHGLAGHSWLVGLDRDDCQFAAKEIADHFREFVEWIGSQDIWFNDTDGLWDYQLISYDGEMKHKTTEELYNYWQTNIKEK